jgi:hypothetical protein
MTAIALIAPAWIVKEIRVLLPAWLGALTVLWLMGLAGEPAIPQVAVIVIASVIIGAISVGHEFANRTLDALLALPASRLRLYVTKTAAAMLLLLLLSLYVIWLPGRENIRLVILLAGLPGLFLAQWLTLRFRGELAGVVFSLALPVAIYFAAGLTTTYFYGPAIGPRDESIDFLWTLFTRMLGAACLGSAMTAWWLFTRTQTVDRSQIEIRLPAWIGRSRAAATPESRFQHPLRALLMKELRLQQMSVAVVVIYLVGWLAITVARATTTAYPGPHLIDLSYVYVVLLSLMVGAQASAEERQRGTLAWQILLPVSVRDQWRVKVATILVLTFALGVGLPALLMGNEPRWTRPSSDQWWILTSMVAILLTSLATYVSSTSSSALRSMLTCFALSNAAENKV